MEIMSQKEKKKKQDLGIYYTPEIVVDFIYDILNILKHKEDEDIKRWESRKPWAHYPSVIDPAVGEGLFLKKAIDSEFTKKEFIFGLDIDEEVVKEWPEISLLDTFNGNLEDLKAHFFHQNGLEKIYWDKYTDKYFRKLKQADIRAQQFNAVVGNPPYGGMGLGETKLTDELITQLAKFEILPKKIRDQLIPADKQPSLLGDEKSFGVKPNAKNRIKSFPIEILFVDRFIQLVKPGGWIAIIIPDGILTNSNLEYVREFIASNTKIEAIVSLPRGTFKQAGTSAKTSILFLTKSKDLETHQKIKNDYPVFLASANSISKDIFNKTSHHYKQFLKDKYMTTANPRKKSNILIKEFPDGTTVRVDITMKKMMMEEPSSRIDASYWSPRYDYLDQIFFKWNAKSLKEIEGKNWKIISGDHVRASRGEKKGFNLNTSIEYYETKGFLETGYDYSVIKECSANAFERLKDTMVIQYDILVSASGVGGVGKGKSSIVLHKPKNKSCTGDVFILRLKKLNPFFIYTFLKTSIGKNQLLRMRSGVGTENINSKQLSSVKVPILSHRIQQNIEQEYRKITAYHDKAMGMEAKGNQKEYEKNIKIAEDMLKDLISCTEQVIRGERKDVI